MARQARAGGVATVVAILAAFGLGIWSAERAAEALGIGASARSGGGSMPSAAGARRTTDTRRTTDKKVGAAPRAPAAVLPSPALTFGGAGGIQLKGGVALAEPAAPEDVGSATDPAAAEGSTAAALLTALARLIRDLEWTPGLPEPKQQTIVPPPDPWRTPEGAAATPSPMIEAIEPGSGPVAGGARVTIRGKHFRPASVVFGHLPAQIVSASPVEIEVVAPGGTAGQVAIAITNDDGNFAIAEQRFTYAPPSATPGATASP